MGGGNRSGSIEVAATLVAKGNKQDFEVETFIAHAYRTSANCGAWDTGERVDALTTGADPSSHIIAHVPETAATLTRGAESAGKGGYAGRRQEDDVNIVAFKASHHTRNKDGAPSLVAPPLSADSDKGDQDTLLLAPVVIFDTTQITSKANRSNPQPGDPCHPLTAEGHVPTVVHFQTRGTNLDLGQDVAGTIGSNADRASGGAPCVAYDMRGREGGARFEGPHDTAAIRAASGGSSRSYVQQGWAVRRLTTVECARLQGFPDHHLRIAWRGKPAEQCPDGNQYKTYGNAMAVNVMAWLGRQIERASYKAQIVGQTQATQVGGIQPQPFQANDEPERVSPQRETHAD